MLSVKKIDTPAGFDSLESIWNCLLEKNSTRNIFVTFRWFRTWWATFGGDHQLYIFSISRDEQVIGIAPMMLTGPPGRRTLRFIAEGNSDMADFIIAEDSEAVIGEVVAYLSSHRRDWDLISLSQIPEESGTARLMAEHMTNAGMTCLVEAVDTRASFVYRGEEDERSEFSLKKSKAMRNQINFFRKNGGLELQVMDNLEEVLRLLPVFFQYHITRWDDTVTPSKFLQEQNRLFYTDLAKELFCRDGLRFLVLMNGDLPIAFFFAFHLNRVIYLYTPSYNVYFTKKSPGIILDNLLVESLIRQGYKEIDFLRGAESYKLRFCNQTTSNLRLRAFRSRIGYYRVLVPQKLKKTGLVRAVISNEKIKSVKDKLASYYDRHGMSGLLRAALRKMLHMVWDYKVLLIFVFKPHYSPWRIKAAIDLDIKKLSVDDMDVICSYLGCTPESAKYAVIKQRFQEGGECFVAMHKGVVACTFWALGKGDRFRDMGKSWLVKGDDMMLSDALTSPLFRGKKVFQELLSVMITHYSDRNIRLWGSVLTSNRVSIQGLSHIGFTVQTKLRSLKVFGIRLI